MYEMHKSSGTSLQSLSFALKIGRSPHGLARTAAPACANPDRGTSSDPHWPFGARPGGPAEKQLLVENTCLSGTVGKAGRLILRPCALRHFATCAGSRQAMRPQLFA
jgi:hypothetical protein